MNSFYCLTTLFHYLQQMYFLWCNKKASGFPYPTFKEKKNSGTRRVWSHGKTEKEKLRPVPHHHPRNKKEGWKRCADDVGLVCVNQILKMCE
jgi:hypothetical protein